MTRYVELKFDDLLIVVGTYVPNLGENIKVRRTWLLDHGPQEEVE
jgi:hypothetical protein